MASGSTDYKNIVTLGVDYIREWDDTAKAPYITYNGQVVCTYDSPESIAIKCAYIHEKGMKGAMYWEYNCDDSNGTLRKAVYNGIFLK